MNIFHIRGGGSGGADDLYPPKFQMPRMDGEKQTMNSVLDWADVVGLDSTPA